MSTDIKLYEDLSISPATFKQDVADAHEKAKVLAEIVESQKLFTQMGQGRHLQVEAWQTIAKGYGCSAAVQSSEILYDPDGVEIGAKAKAIVYDQNGVIRGEAEGYCMRDEPNWKVKPIFQLVSMAGTRGVSKALRLMFSWVVVLAGYSATPAEEMVQDSQQRHQSDTQPLPRQSSTRTVTTKLGNCEKHRKVWADTPDGIGHPLDGGEWCLRDEGGKDAELETPSMNNRADLELKLTDLSWLWETFLEEILESDWEEWIKLNGGDEPEAVRIAWERFETKATEDLPF